MKIKDIREYRTFYKEKVLEISDQNRNEHFIGVKGKNADGTNAFGYFNITHGDKIKDYTDGIKGFLEGFLDMARDAQAVYEFLQNAVDANSSRFVMIWDKDENDDNEYLLVINNGFQFDFASVRSILNVGVSAKGQDQHTIGKFGIGFKLAHRLVGKDNGLDELLNRNYGPLLFSWQNKDILQLLNSENGNVEPVKQFFTVQESGDKVTYNYEGVEPWLFKILITNFPSQPGEDLHDVYYNPTDQAFRKEEVIRLAKWLRNAKDIIPMDDFHEGSLFFIRLGEDKRQHLEDETLAEGVKFSLSVLNRISDENLRGLKNVHLNGIDIESAELDFEEFLLEKSSPQFNYVRFGREHELNENEARLIEKDVDIQLLFGYTAYEKATTLFSNVPNFYLYFPLSVEKHNLKFIVHSNAFYKASHRTSLHVGTKERYGINERLLEIFAHQLIERMKTWSISDAASDRMKFLKIYPVLLLSDLSEDHDRAWINEPLVSPLHQFLAAHIPVTGNAETIFEIEHTVDNVRIKVTSLDINPLYFGLNIKWFFWNNDDVLKSSVSEVLRIKEFTILDLLYKKDVSAKINDLLKKDADIRKVLLKEINANIIFVIGTSSTVEIFKENFHELNLFEFENGVCRSINDLRAAEGKEKYLLLFEEIVSIKHLLSKAGFIVTVESLAMHPNIQDFVRKRQSVSYNDYKVLNEYLSIGFEITQFTPEEKHFICQTIEKAKDKETEVERNQRMQVLRLFSNEQGDVVALGVLIKEASKSWLKPFEINKQEYQDYLLRYLIQAENDMFVKVVIPLWDLVIADKNHLIKRSMKAFYEDVVSFQKATQQTQTLSGRVFIPVQDTFVLPAMNICYQPDWVKMNEQEYSALTLLFKKLFDKELPAYVALPYLYQAPFRLNTTNFDALILETQQVIIKEEICLLAKAAELAKFPFFSRFIIQPHALGYLLRERKENELIAWCGNDAKLEAYIRKYQAELLICPHIPELKEFIELQGKELCEYFISKWDGIDLSVNDSLSEIITSQEDSIKIIYLEKYDHIHFEINNFNGYETLKNAVKVTLSFGDITIAKPILQSYLRIYIDRTNFFTLNDVISSVGDVIYFGEGNEYSMKLSDIFTDDRTNYAKYVSQVVHKLSSDYLFYKSQLNQLFNISEEGDKEDILGLLNNAIQQQGYLANASQLCYILLYRKYHSPHIDFSFYRLKSGESTIPLEGAFALSSDSFNLFESKAYLDKIYHGIPEILKLSAFSPVFIMGEVSFYIQPIIEKNALLGPGLKMGLSSEEQIQLLDFLLRYYRGSNTLTCSPSWSEVFGFTLGLYVSSKYSFKEKEALPTHISSWRQGDQNEQVRKDKNSLLGAIGFNLPWSDISILREVLIEEYSKKSFQLSGLEGMRVELLVNTLKFIRQERPDYQFSQLHMHYNLIKEIVRKCIQHKRLDIPLPVKIGHINEFHFVDYDKQKVYYHDIETQITLLSSNIQLYELINAVSIQVYDAINWTELPELKALLYDIKLEKRWNLELIRNGANEWNEKFYEEWKIQYPEITLFYYEALSTELFIEDQYVKTIMEDKCFISEKNVYCPMKFSFQEIVKILKTTDWFQHDALDELIKLYDRHQMRVMDLLNNPIPDEEIRKMVDDKKKELEEIAHKKELIEGLMQSKYSFKWLLNFIELQKIQSGEADNTVPEQEISFFLSEWEPDSKRIIRLKDPNRTITPTIEFCTDFRAIFYPHTGKPLEVRIQSVSKKGQTVLAMLSKPADLNGVGLNNIKRVELRFSRSVDLLGRLFNAFKRLGGEREWSDDYNLKEDLSSNIHFIYGPPGTGKTTTVAERLVKLMNDEPNAKVLVLTPTNKAADVMAKKIMDKTGSDNYWLVRYGATFSNEIIEQGVLQDADTFIYEAYKQCVVISTIHRLPYEQIILKIEDKEPVRAVISDIHWDYVIFDESSMIPLTYITFAIHKCDNGNTKYWVAGDPMQIPPVIDMDDEDLPKGFEKEENIYTMIGLNSFDVKLQQLIPKYGNKIENLKRQYRAIESIGRLFSKFTYQDELIHNRATLTDNSKDPRLLPEKIRELGIKPITLLKFPVNQNEAIYLPGKLRYSPYHFYSAFLVVEIIRYFEKSIHLNESWSVGIVCPYRSQATVVNKIIESLNLKPNLNVITDTVHGFQGDECDIVFFLVNPPNYTISHPSYGAFIHKHYLINVAISRAKDYLVLLYPDNDTAGISNLVKINRDNSGSIEDILTNQMGIDLDTITITGDEVEQQLFKESKHIEKNIFTNKHQLVNVYGVADKKYLVKESTTAIDIQFKT